MSEYTNNIAVKADNLSKTFKSAKRQKNIGDFIKFSQKENKHKSLKALNNLNFEIQKGEFFGIIGRNGSGKSTLLKILLGNMLPDSDNSLFVDGEIMRLAMGIGFNNMLTARDNIYINGSILGLSFREIGDLFDEILEFAEVEDFVDTQIKNYSSGMRARLMFSIAIHAKSDILLLDELFGGVGDEGFRRKSSEAFQGILKEGRTIIMVSHSLNIIEQYCSRVLVLNKGDQLIVTEPKEAVIKYRELFKGPKRQ